jgi:hypothetical protein
MCDGNLWEGFGVWYGVELLSARLPGANERDERVGVGFRVFALLGGVSFVYEGETVPWGAWK